MLRRVWFSKGLEITDDVVSASELGFAAFALVVQYTPPKKGVYKAFARMKPRDESVLALIDKHKLRGVEVYIDRTYTAADKNLAGLRDEGGEALRTKGLAYIWSPESALNLAKQVMSWVERERSVKITLGTLLEGIEVSGKMEEVSFWVHTLTGVVDKLSAKIATGSTFDAGEIRVYAPGNKKKVEKQKPNTPPARWGK